MAGDQSAASDLLFDRRGWSTFRFLKPEHFLVPVDSAVAPTTSTEGQTTPSDLSPDLDTVSQAAASFVDESPAFRSPIGTRSVHFLKTHHDGRGPASSVGFTRSTATKTATRSDANAS